MQLSKEEYARKRIHNGSSVQIENSVTLVTARHLEPRDAEQLSSWRNFQGVIGSEGINKCNSNGILLLWKFAEQDLLITNAGFRLPNRNKTSWMHPCSKHLIDDVIVRRKDRQDIGLTKTHVWSRLLNRSYWSSANSAYNNICKIVQIRFRDMQDSRLSRKAKEIQSFADRKDMKKFHDALRTVYGSKRSETIASLSTDGSTLLTDKDDILKRRAIHVDSVLNRPSCYQQIATVST